MYFQAKNTLKKKHYYKTKWPFVSVVASAFEANHENRRLVTNEKLIYMRGPQ
jgi:hypothetical protein